MKYIIFSDVHGNLQALEATVRSFPRESEKKIICGGDIVGYGANPGECIEIISKLGCVNVKGNHEAAVLGEIDIACFNDYAREAVMWTRKHLTAEETCFIKDIPLVFNDGTLTVAHGTLHEAGEFRYMLSGREAARTFEMLETQLCFVGHSHVPDAFVLRDREMYGIAKERFKLEKEARYIINVGSVGQPRDLDERACYCVYDTEANEIELRRIKYDVKTARKKIIEAGLPEMLGDRLITGN